MDEIRKVFCSMNSVIDYLYSQHIKGDSLASALYYQAMEARDALVAIERGHGPFA